MTFLRKTSRTDSNLVRLLPTTSTEQTNSDLWAVSVTGDHKAFSIVQANADVRSGQFSPDGHWIAYSSDESGRVEVYVQPFPGPGDRVVVSTAGGGQPRWRGDGKELFYIALDGRLMAVPMAVRGTTLEAHPGTATPLFKVRVPGGVVQQGANRQQYAVTRDGQRFFVIVPTDSASSPISLILNWRPGS